MKSALALSCLLLHSAVCAAAESTEVYFGDTHIHTSWSADAFSLGQNILADPDTAHRWAMGLPVIHPHTRARVRIGTPLDFLVVADHAEYLGMLVSVIEERDEIVQTDAGKRIVEVYRDDGFSGLFNKIVFPMFLDTPGSELEELNTSRLRRLMWTDHVAFSERYNRPGAFTSLIGWEWTALPNLADEGDANYHRVIMTDADQKIAEQFIPFSARDSERAEDLWAWLDKTESRTGARFVSIPHNSNLSRGMMFPEVDESGQPITAEYARFRMRWEPVMEMTQVKGDSETHPELSRNDEFADYERYEHMFGGKGFEPDRGDFARTALLRGLEIDAKVGANPYKFGMIGSTDAHTALATAEEENFWGKMAVGSIPETKNEQVMPGVVGWDMSAAGLAAVWAEENTREEIVDAFRRREVYATTGPRIRLRFFGGWDFKTRDADARNLAEMGYDKGVPMGGDLTAAPTRKAPRFLIQAVKDPKDANLDRVQVVKGWLDSGGNSHERVFDVSWSGERQPGEDGRLPPVGDTVDRTTASYTNDIGAAELTTVWEDPEFDRDTRAFYYVRVLQIPTPRHSLYDAVALDIDPAETKHPAVIQERAYSSPIWYTP